MDRYFILLGANKLLWGQVCHLRELGYKVVVVAWNDQPDIQGDLYIQMDVKDAKGIIARLEELGLSGQVDGALSSIDLAAPTVNAINAWCGNKTMPEKFNQVLSKDEMREAWMSAKLFNRLSVRDDEITLGELLFLSQKMKLICKPDVSASSRGITILEKNQSETALQNALDKAKQTSFNGKCLIEEFVEGEEFTVDMLGDAYGNVNCYGSSIQYHSKYALHNHVTVIHHWNSTKYDAATWNRIADFGIQCYKALGLHSMFGHLEIIMKADGTFTPVEMGARSSGFICSHTVWKASGRDYLADYIKVLHGEKIQAGNYMNGDNASMWFGYDIPSNSHSVKATDITEFLDSRIQVLFENHDGLTAGRNFGDYIDDGDRDKFGYAILTAPRNILTYSSVSAANEQFLDEFLGRK
ncbi:MAG: ATP-grasp domain-containing protein [Bacteroidales bacterium]|nr:ATP-grasp domain-containing protein [Bacteroidales bacterium]